MHGCNKRTGLPLRRVQWFAGSRRSLRCNSAFTFLPFLSLLTLVFQASEFHYLKGHLALLLGLLFTKADSKSQPDFADLPNPGDSDYLKVKQLIDVIQDFSAAYSSLSRHLAGDGRSSLRSGTSTPNSPESQVSSITAGVIDSLRELQRNLT